MSWFTLHALGSRSTKLPSLKQFSYVLPSRCFGVYRSRCEGITLQPYEQALIYAESASARDRTATWQKKQASSANATRVDELAIENPGVEVDTPSKLSKRKKSQARYAGNKVQSGSSEVSHAQTSNLHFFEDAEKSDEPHPRQSIEEIFNLTDAHKNKEISDSFCARMFATTAFSFKTIIKTLEVFGVKAIGPLSLREVALRSGTTAELLEHIEVLSASGISLRKCVFNNAVLSFVDARESDLLRSLLDTDQHPDVLEVKQIQKNLLRHYISRDEWVEIERTIAILDRFLSYPASKCWNLYLCHAADAQRLERVAKIVDKMLVDGIPLARKSIIAVGRGILPYRNRGKNPPYSKTHPPNEHLSFAINNLLCILEHGQRVPSWLWNEITHRIYLSGSVRQLEKLCLCLANHYKEKDDQRVIFNPIVQQAILRMYFKYAFGPGFRPSDPLAWAGGIDLLRRLMLLGVKMNKHQLRMRIINILADLYGPQKPDFALWKRHAVANNKISFEDMVSDINTVWGRALLKCAVYTRIKMDMILLYRRDQRVAKRRREYNRTHGIPSRRSTYRPLKV